jgi:hypothetical protein
MMQRGECWVKGCLVDTLDGGVDILHNNIGIEKKKPKIEEARRELTLT